MTTNQLTRLTVHEPGSPEIGEHITVMFRGERVAGTVTSRSFDSPVEGVHPLDVLHLQLDQPVTTPTGRLVHRIYVTRATGALATIERA